jgi:hypothetical protein
MTPQLIRRLKIGFAIAGLILAVGQCAPQPSDSKILETERSIGSSHTDRSTLTENPTR